MSPNVKEIDLAGLQGVGGAGPLTICVSLRWHWNWDRVVIYLFIFSKANSGEKRKQSASSKALSCVRVLYEFDVHYGELCFIVTFAVTTTALQMEKSSLRVSLSWKGGCDGILSHQSVFILSLPFKEAVVIVVI